MLLIISIRKEVRDEDDAREAYAEITEALANINPELEVQGRVSAQITGDES